MSATVNTMMRQMARWEPGARGRLEEAAFALYAERGYEQTTVAEIAERAGLTERTFFRHFADKREVLFSGADALQDALVTAVADAPAAAPPIEAAAMGIQAIAALLPSRAIARRRQEIISANPELQERELIKLARLAAALADALRRRGVQDPAAGLTAETGIAVLRVAFEHWLRHDSNPHFEDSVREAIAELRTVAAS